MEILKGKIALITGASGGIGSAQDGISLALLGRSEEKLAATAASVREYGVETLLLPGDLLDDAYLEDCFAAVKERFGGLDILVNNAGTVERDTLLEDMTEEVWHNVLNVNLNGVFLNCKYALPYLRERRGCVVSMSSTSGLVATKNDPAYCASKTAIVGLTRAIAADYAQYGVRANAVCPGWVRTPMADEEMGVLVREAGLADIDSAYATATKDVPLGRPAEAAEIAGVVAFLLGPDATYVHGSTVVVDGGAHVVDVPTLAFGPEAP